jgi:hypothetical protein
MDRFTRRDLIAGLLTASLSINTVSPAAAQSKGAGNGKSGNNGNGRGQGNGNGRGNSGSSNAGGSGKGGAKGGEKSGTAGGMGAAESETSQNSLKPGGTKDRLSNLRVRHSNGFEEALSRGRYTMKDNRGRTIVNRSAGPSDYDRLRRLTGN